MKKLILIVDDDEEITNLFSDFLGSRGFDIKVVHNGENALAEAIKVKPDLIILDIMMPKIDGYDVLDILRNTSKTSAIPIIVLTALNSSDDFAKAKKLGAEAFLDKPTVELETIYTKINELLDQH